MRPVFLTGALVALAMGGTLEALAQTTPGPSAGDAAAGQDLFLDRCAMCHIAEGGGQGPSLQGVYGRKAASAPGFAYSAALKASGLDWTPANLSSFWRAARPSALRQRLNMSAARIPLKNCFCVSPFHRPANSNRLRLSFV